VPALTPSPDRALTPAQKHALLAMPPSADADIASVAEATGMRPNGVALALRGLERRGFVARQPGDSPAWRITFTGRALMQRLTREPA
jgi:DNA-binding MarR family transcriptional regulator